MTIVSFSRIERIKVVCFPLAVSRTTVAMTPTLIKKNLRKQTPTLSLVNSRTIGLPLPPNRLTSVLEPKKALRQTKVVTKFVANSVQWPMCWIAP